MDEMNDARALGIRERHMDYRNRWTIPPASTIEALARALTASSPPPKKVRSVRPGDSRALLGAAELHTEDGRILDARAAEAGDLPLGYHRLVGRDDDVSDLIVTPRRCRLPAGLKAWGWALQLYATRSRRSWGMGDLSDLAAVAERSRRSGAGIVMVNPLHAVNPGVPQQASPYSPSSRCWRNPLYLRIEDVDGASTAGPDLERLASAGRALNAGRVINRDAVYRLKLAALEELWPRFRSDAGFDHFVRLHGSMLDGFATFMTLHEANHGPPSMWPSEYRHPQRPEVARFARDHADRVAFHKWVQWLIDEQLRRASASLSVIHDLAIGVDPGGADAWFWQDALTGGASIGAPPDRFNARGQDWGLLTFNPLSLRSGGLEPFVQTVRAAFRHAGGIRFDHIMGLWRLFMIPAGASPAEGAYVDYPSELLLDILALESHRAGAFVIGEDLGTVEQQVHRELVERSILSYRVMWFEEKRPSSYPIGCLATVTNHDLPTISGLWNGTDLDAQKRMGLRPDEDAVQAVRTRLTKATGLRAASPPEEVVRKSYELLGRAPSAVLTATFDDALMVDERPNHPGTTHEWPNWSLALPETLEDVFDNTLVDDIARALTR